MDRFRLRKIVKLFPQTVTKKGARVHIFSSTAILRAILIYIFVNINKQQVIAFVPGEIHIQIRKLHLTKIIQRLIGSRPFLLSVLLLFTSITLKNIKTAPGYLFPIGDMNNSNLYAEEVVALIVLK